MSAITWNKVRQVIVALLLLVMALGIVHYSVQNYREQARRLTGTASICPVVEGSEEMMMHVNGAVICVYRLDGWQHIPYDFTITDAASGEAPVRFYPDPDTGTMQTQRLGE